MTSSSPTQQRSTGRWIRWLVLPLLLGVVTLVMIVRTEKREMEIAIDVSFTHLADDLLIMNPSSQNVRLLVVSRSPGFDAAASTGISCKLDLSGLRAGTHKLAIEPSDVTLPKEVELKALLTPFLTIHLEPVVLKTVDVVAVLEGNAAPGYAVTAVKLEPDRVVLKGTAGSLADIETVKTHPINLEEAAESFKKEVPLNLPEAIAVDPPLRIAVARVEVTERIVTRVLENIPVTVKGASTEYRIEPQTIMLTVSGPEAVVNALESNTDFSVTVDLSGLAPGRHLLKAAIHLPVGTTLTRVDPEQFSVTINK
ncbi:CdaR family protein [uncultured Desulfosarcina sp.]|uniref:CdaR family protein n=1 Tax=uncultured Desulfosarcina sp. TaxID=218289 RepID=UPI0029C82E26|nr:CdaR family protein [uncultured Desulfosarcina sp.]